MLTAGLGIAVVILIFFIVITGWVLVTEVVEHEDLKKRHEVLRDQHCIWVRRAVFAERKVEEADEGRRTVTETASEAVSA